MPAQDAPPIVHEFIADDLAILAQQGNPVQLVTLHTLPFGLYIAVYTMHLPHREGAQQPGAFIQAWDRADALAEPEPEPGTEPEPEPDTDAPRYRYSPFWHNNHTGKWLLQRLGTSRMPTTDLPGLAF